MKKEQQKSLLFIYLNNEKAPYFFGVTTASITWITPLLAARSAAVTFAPSIITLPSLIDTVNSAP